MNAEKNFFMFDLDKVLTQFILQKKDFVKIDQQRGTVSFELTWTADGTRIGNSRSLVLAGRACSFCSIYMLNTASS